MEKYPDAIRCGADGFVGATFLIHNSQHDNRVFYDQIQKSQYRRVVFNADGGYYTGHGHYESRKGCQSKNLSTLDKEGRTIYYALDTSMGKNQKKLDEENAIQTRITKLEEQETTLRNKTAKLEEQQLTMRNKMSKIEQQENIMNTKIQKLQNKISELKKKLLSFSNNFWDYEQIKQKWFRDFEKEIIANIKSKGLQIGSGWKLQQQGNSFTIRDSVGSNVKDSRHSFPPDTYSNPK